VPISVNPLPLVAPGFVCAATVVIDVNAIATSKNAIPLPSFGFVSRIDALRDPGFQRSYALKAPRYKVCSQIALRVDAADAAQKIKLESGSELHVLRFARHGIQRDKPECCLAQSGAQSRALSG
jgi:hypothetical protein